MEEINQEGPGLKEEPVTFREMRRKAAIFALARNNGNRTHAAIELQVSIRTLRNWIKEFDLPAAKPTFNRKPIT